MAQCEIKLSVRLAWWAMPSAYLIALFYRPFVGADRAIKVAEWICLRGIRIELK